MIRLLALVLAVFALSPLARAQGTAADPLGQALAMLERAASLSQSEPNRAATIAADAAVLLRSTLTDADRDNPEAQRALGNAYLLAGDLGRAVLAYRRASNADPSDRQIRASLAHARSLVAAAAPTDTATRAHSLVRAARQYLPRAVVFWTGAAAVLVACVVLAARLHAAVPFARSTAGALLALATLAAGALILDDQLARDPNAAVVLLPTTARTGPDNAVYPPALETPVPAGAEGVIRDTRPGWALVALGSAEAWLPADRVERVRP